jgi:hypothetical protein
MLVRILKLGKGGTFVFVTGYFIFELDGDE